MKFSTLCLTGLAAGALGCVTKPCAGRCVAALSDVLEVGEAFCSSYLSLDPATETVTQTATATAVHTDIETIVEVVTQTTLTTTINGAPTTIFAKRQQPTADVSSQILAQCNNAASRVSSACSCILSTTSTTTVVETVTATESAEATITTIATLTTGVVATEQATPTVTITNPIINGAFEDYVTTNNLLPWTGTSGGAASNARVEPLTPLSVCDTDGYCPGGSVIIRVYPGTLQGDYFSLAQDSFVAKPSTTYSVSFLYRCLNYDANSGIDVYFQGVRVGGNRCANGNFNHITSGIQFTTDETGAGALEFRFLNPSGLPYIYYYADAFQATAI